MEPPSTVQLGVKLIEACREKGITARLLGGVAVYLLVKEVYTRLPSLARSPKDVDLISLSKESDRLSKIFSDLGLQGDRRFNALHGHERLRFLDPSGIKVDVFLDAFRESHTLPLKERLRVFEPTIPPSDLLLTKLQIWQITERDLRDLVAIFLKFKLSSRDSGEEVDLRWIAKLTGEDWGLYRTLTVNLDRLVNYVDSLEDLRELRGEVERKVRELRGEVERAPKSVKWRMRALIGERMKWYEEPEEA